MEIIVAILIGVLSSVCASFIFIYTLSQIKPKIEISEKIACGVDSNGNKYYAIKVVNRKKRDCINVKVEFALIRSRIVIGGRIYRAEKIPLIKDQLMLIPQYKANIEDTLYAFRFRTLEDLETKWTNENSHYRFRIIATDSLSGFSKVFERKYYTKNSTFVKGDFAKGVSMKIGS